MWLRDGFNRCDGFKGIAYGKRQKGVTSLDALTLTGSCLAGTNAWLHGHGDDDDDDDGDDDDDDDDHDDDGADGAQWE